MAERILIADDSLLIRKVANQTFLKQGYQLSEACDGREALKLLNQSPEAFALVISDWNMPNMNGYELLLSVKNSKSLCHIPFVIVTTDSVKANINKALQAGAADYIIKPFSAQDLLKIAEKYINKIPNA